MLTIEEENNTPEQYNFRKKVRELYRLIYIDLIDRVLQYAMS